LNELNSHSSPDKAADCHAGLHWYVVQTKPQSEDRVAMQFKMLRDRNTAIFEEVGDFSSDELVGMDIFLPKMRSVSHSGADGVERLKPLFPSYVFLKWNLTEPKNHRLVRFTRGVNRVLGDMERAVPISDDVIEIIRARTNARGVLEQQMYKKGDLVKVKRGHLKELVGVLDRPVSDSGRVNVLLQIFNRQLNVELRCADIAHA